MDNNNTGNTEHNYPDGRPTVRAFTVHPGMNVRSSDGFSLGLVDRLFMDEGMISRVQVAHGPGARRHKRVDFQVVDHLEGETVILSMTAAEFRLLPEYDSDHKSQGS